MHLYYSAAYTAAAHVFDTTRKAGWIAESVDRAPVPGSDRRAGGSPNPNSSRAHAGFTTSAPSARALR